VRRYGNIRNVCLLKFYADAAPFKIKVLSIALRVWNFCIDTILLFRFSRERESRAPGRVQNRRYINHLPPKAVAAHDHVKT
jgi:hypothetical protein